MSSGTVFSKPGRGLGMIRFPVWGSRDRRPGSIPDCRRGGNGCHPVQAWQGMRGNCGTPRTMAGHRPSPVSPGAGFQTSAGGCLARGRTPSTPAGSTPCRRTQVDRHPIPGSASDPAESSDPGPAEVVSVGPPEPESAVSPASRSVAPGEREVDRPAGREPSGRVSADSRSRRSGSACPSARASSWSSRWSHRSRRIRMHHQRPRIRRQSLQASIPSSHLAARAGSR